MKSLTLHQPWASLVSLGVKTIETRSWATRYRGPLAIHAGAKKPTDGLTVGVWTAREYADGRWGLFENDGDISDPMPLGAVVATCQLVDCVETDSLWDCDPAQWAVNEEDAEHLRLAGWGRDGGEPAFVVTDQLPYGDFASGRWAWLLEDIVALAQPAPAKGHQGLWTWEP